MTIFNLFSVNSLLFAVLVRLQLLQSLALTLSQEKVILGLGLSALFLLSALSNVTRASTIVASTSSAFSSSLLMSPRTSNS